MAGTQAYFSWMGCLLPEHLLQPADCARFWKRHSILLCIYILGQDIHSALATAFYAVLRVGRRSPCTLLLFVLALCNTAREALLLWAPWYLVLGIHTRCSPTSPNRLISEANTLLPAWVPAVHTGRHPSLLSLPGASIPRAAVPSWGQCSHQA